MDERLKLIARLLDGDQMAGLCREFGISRKTGYKIVSRYNECGLEALSDRSRRPYRQANQLPFQIEKLIVRLKQEKPQGKERFLVADELTRLGDTLRRAETEGLPWKIYETKPTAKHLPRGLKLRTIDPHAAAAIRLLILTGARLREILHAKWEFVNWERGAMDLPDSKSGKKTIYLSAAALAVLKAIPRLPGNPYIIPGEKRLRKGEGRRTQEAGPPPLAPVSSAPGRPERALLASMCRSRPPTRKERH